MAFLLFFIFYLASNPYQIKYFILAFYLTLFAYVTYEESKSNQITFLLF